jgi:hypothetical protein
MSTEVEELVRQLYVAGAEVTATAADTLRITGHPVSKALAERLREHKQEIIRILRQQGVGTNADGLDSPLPRRYLVPSACISDRVCSRIGPCSQSLMRHGCVRISENHSDGSTSLVASNTTYTEDKRVGEQHETELQHAH